MPIYEYACRSCGHELEQLQKMSDPHLTTCPACQAETLVRKVSAAGFRLAGSGWYETDFKSSGKRNLAGGDNKPSSDTKSGGDSKAAADKPSASKSSGAKSSASKPAA